MNCCEFREKYSDFADGLLTSQENAEVGFHLAVCAACRRFDAALRLGVDTLRALPGVGVSRTFGARLRRRLRGEFVVQVPVVARWSGVVGTLLLVAAVGVIGWDRMESRATRHAAAWPTNGWNPAPLAVNDQAPLYRSARVTPVEPRFEAFHPLNSILIVEEARPAMAEDPARVDIPAVWGGP